MNNSNAQFSSHVCLKHLPSFSHSTSVILNETLKMYLLSALYIVRLDALLLHIGCWLIEYELIYKSYDFTTRNEGYSMQVGNRHMSYFYQRLIFFFLPEIAIHNRDDLYLIKLLTYNHVYIN